MLRAASEDCGKSVGQSRPGGDDRNAECRGRWCDSGTTATAAADSMH